MVFVSLLPMKRFIFLLFGLTGFIARADSPLTSTYFAKNYVHVTAVKNVVDQQLRIPGKEQFDFLDNVAVPLDEKTALINAMGWGDSVRFDVYKTHISKKYGITLSLLDSIFTFRGPQPVVFPGTEKISAEDLCCMAYFRAMTDYQHPLTSYYCAYIAVDKKPGSMAASYVYGLILAQVYLNLDWCRLYESMQAIKNFDGFNTDSLNQDAIRSIFEYMDSYKTSCKTEEEKIVKEPEYKKPEKRQVIEKEKYVELSVVENISLDYDAATSGTVFHIQIMNSGTVESIETNLRITDLDITYKQAKKIGLKGDALNVIKEVNAGAHKGEEIITDETYLEEGIDYDKDFELIGRIPPIKPGEIIMVTVILKNQYVYDPSCEIEINIDFDNNIEEKNEKNNTTYFVEWG
jgi:hypothetical protein